MLSKVSRSLVACNIYVSAGGHPSHRELLLGLLGETQELCRSKNKNAESATYPSMLDPLRGRNNTRSRLSGTPGNELESMAHNIG